MNGQRILIIGHRGFIGRKLGDMIQVSFPEARIVSLKAHLPRSQEELKALLLDLVPDYVFHMASPAGAPSNGDRHWLHENLVQPTTLLLETLHRLRSKARVVIPGSVSEYGVVTPNQLPVGENFVERPVSPYAQGKLAQTLEARRYAEEGLNVVIGRIFNVIGKDASEHTLIGSFQSRLRVAVAQNGHGTVDVGDLRLRRDFVDIVDVARALMMIAIAGKSGEVYNICSGRSVFLRDVLNQMIACTGASIEVREVAGFAHNPVTEIFGSPERISRQTGWFPRYQWDEAIKRIYDIEARA